MSKPKPPAAGPDLRRLLAERMAACRTPEELNNRVIQPFVQALEKHCGAEGYLLNIYGETANLVFTGDPDAAEDIYAMVEEYLDARAQES